MKCSLLKLNRNRFTEESKLIKISAFQTRFQKELYVSQCFDVLFKLYKTLIARV